MSQPTYSSIAILSVVSALALAVGACGARTAAPGGEVYFDVLADFPLAEVRVETPALDFGTARARAQLGTGWSGAEFDKRRGETFVWGIGSASTLRFELVAVRDLVWNFRCRSGRLPPGRSQAVRLVVNGREVEEVELGGHLDDYEVSIPAVALQVGENELRLEYRLVRGRDYAAKDGESRPVAVAWYRLDLGTGAPSAKPAELVNGQLVMAHGAQLDYYFRPLPDSVFELEGLSFRGGRQARLEVRLTQDGVEQRILARMEPGEEVPTFSLGDLLDAPVRLSLAAFDSRSAAPGAAAGGIALEAPVVRGRSKVPARTESARARRWNVVIYLVDTLRADRLGCYGYDRPVSPRLDAFAADATLFSNAIGQSTWTRASVASLLTGLWPHSHNANGRRDRLATEAITLQEVLRDAGYATAAFVTNPNVGRTFGFGQGFQSFIPFWRAAVKRPVSRRVLHWLDERDDPDQPFLLYVHTVEPHAPYLPPEEFRRKFAADADDMLTRIQQARGRHVWEPTDRNIEQLNALYDAEVAHADANFGELIEALEQRGLYDNTIVVFLSDHGEEFYDHRAWTHGKNLYAETLDFPLIIRWPGFGNGESVEHLAGHVDVMPTLLASLGLPVPQGVHGADLRSYVASDDALGDDEAAFAYLRLDGPLHVGLVERQWKLVQRQRGTAGTVDFLFEWQVDRDERDNLAHEHPVARGYMASRIKETMLDSTALAQSEATLDPELEASLRALGYLQ